MVDIAIACAASAVGGAIAGILGIAPNVRNEFRKLRNDLRRLRNGEACRDRIIGEQEHRIERLKGWLRERDGVISVLEEQVATIKAKRSATTAAGNRKRRLNRLARKAKRTMATVDPIGSGYAAPSKTASVGEGV